MGQTRAKFSRKPRKAGSQASSCHLPAGIHGDLGEKFPGRVREKVEGGDRDDEGQKVAL